MTETSPIANMSHTDYLTISGVAPTSSADEQPNVWLVIGKTGNGKSALCNTILGVERFLTGRSMSSTTLQMQAADTNRDEFHIKVVDTPDVTNLDWTKQEMQQEVQKWKDTIRDLPYIVLLAVRCDVRYTAEEYAVYQQVCQLLGDSFVKSRLVVAFTFGDRQDGDIGEELKTVCRELQSVLWDAGDRYVVFNNEADTEKKDTAVKKVLQFARSFKQTTHLPKVDNLLYAFFGLLVLEGVVMAGWIVLTFLPFELHEEADVLGIFGTVLAILLPLEFWWTIVKKIKGFHSPNVDKVFVGSSVLNGVVVAFWIVLTFLPLKLQDDAEVLGIVGSVLVIVLPLVILWTIVKKMRGLHSPKIDKVFVVSSVLNGDVMALWIVLTFPPFELQGEALVPGMVGTAFAIMLPIVFWFTIVEDMRGLRLPANNAE